MSDAAATLHDLLGERPESITALSGGDISQCWRARLPDGREVVLKSADNAGAEAAMLIALDEAGVPVPQVLASRPDAFAMTHVAGGGAVDWGDLGRVLTRLHAVTGRDYGWRTDHVFGALPIPNAQTADWPQFWAENRLLNNAPHVAPTIGRRLETLAATIANLLPAFPPPSLLHGDLWGGNIIAAPDGRVAALIDPACYHGHREVDWAMLTLFDHPPDAFFAAMAPEPGWRDRLPAYRLWPLLVHLRLFGDTYRGAVERALSECGV